LQPGQLRANKCEELCVAASSSKHAEDARFWKIQMLDYLKGRGYMRQLGGQMALKCI
jgi:hypothetical protein